MKLKLLCTIVSNAKILSHFLEHYHSQGVTDFYFLRYDSAEAITIPEKFKNCVTVIDTCWREGVREYDCDIVSPYQLLQKLFVKKEEWYMGVDLDEFITMPDNMSLIETIKECELQGFNYINGKFVDRSTIDHTLPNELLNNIWEQFPNTSNITGDIAKACTKKSVATKGFIKLCPGHHDVTGDTKHLVKTYPIKGNVNHFKWWGDVLTRMHRRFYEKKLLVPEFKYTNEQLYVCQYFKYEYLQDMIEGKPPINYIV